MVTVASFLYLSMILSREYSQRMRGARCVYGRAPVALRPLGHGVERARQETASKGRPRDSAHAKEFERGEHLTLFLAVDEAVVVLH